MSSGLMLKYFRIFVTSSLKFVIGSVFEFRFSNGSFDHLFLYDALHHIDDGSQELCLNLAF